MADDDSLLKIRFETTDLETISVSDWSISSAYMTSTDGFTFTLVDSDRANLRDIELQPVELSVNGCSQVIGRVEITTVGDNGNAVMCEGRDYIAELVEGNVDPVIKVKDGDLVGSVFSDVARPYGIRTIFSDDEILMRNVRTGINVKLGKGGKSYANRVLKEYKPKVGEGAYEFLNRLIARFGATMQPGPDRESLCITQPKFDQDPSYTLVRTDDTTASGRNNVIRSTAKRDFSQFPTYCLTNGWQASGDGKAVSSKIEFDTFLLAEALGNRELARVLQRSTLGGRRKPVDAQPNHALLYRLLYVKDEEARTQEQLEFSARRAIAERLRPTLEYRATIRGHVEPESGAVWSIDTIVQVEDDICGVSEPLWISDRTLSYSAGAGATTEITAIRPGSFQLG